MQKIFTFFFVSAICVSTVTSSFAQVNTQDSLALVNLYNSTNGASWTNTVSANQPWLVGPVSNWLGVTLNFTGNNVIGITLNNNNLSGSIPASIGVGNLSNLDTLILGNNQIGGGIPASIGNLTNLNSLVLGNNQLTGSIPTSLGNLTNLVSLDLSANLLTSSIPYSLGNLVNLTNELYLYSNQLTGSIPGTLGNLVNLQDLELNNNQLSGSIPDSLQTLISLNNLTLAVNNLSGSIPASLNNLFNLNTLYLYNNDLTGGIPSLTNLTSLVNLSLGFNQLSGPIPSSLGTLPSLNGLSLTHNQFSGSIPSSLGNSSLFFLDLSYNFLNGSVPLSFANLLSSSTEIKNNNLTFDGMEQAVTALGGGSSSTFIDSPQAAIPIHLNGSVLSTYAGGTLANDTFHWYRNNILDTTIVGDSLFSPIFVANYSVIVTNKIVSPGTGIPGSALILYSDTILAGLILPVTFLNFTGELTNYNTALLHWQTATELNTSYFNIQRSTDGVNFVNIGKTDAAGNTSGTENYQYTDNLATLVGQPSNLFYRLQEVDKDGNSTLSKVVDIALGSQVSPITIYPNPATDFLNVALGNNAGNALINIVDANGTKIFEQQQMIEQNTTTRINTSGFATGVYFIQVSINGLTLQQTFIKQ
jgi:Leucine-rich repeat (LRR) protein